MNIPTTKHWAIITRETIVIPGDERSRTNPGHGYPEHTEEVIKYEAFTTEEEFLAKLDQTPSYMLDKTFGIEVSGVYELKVKSTIVRTRS